MIIHPDTWFQKLLLVGPGSFWDAPFTRDASNHWEDSFFGGLDPVTMASLAREHPQSRLFGPAYARLNLRQSWGICHCTMKTNASSQRIGI